MSNLNVNSVILGTYTIKDFQDVDRANGLPVPSIEEVLIRESKARKELHDRIGYVDPRGYFHLNGEVKVSKTSKSDKMSKADRAVEIYKRLNGVRPDVVKAFQEELGLSAATSMPYFYKSKKAAEDQGFGIPAPKVEKKAKAKKEPMITIESDKPDSDLEIEEIRKLAA